MSGLATDTTIVPFVPIAPRLMDAPEVIKIGEDPLPEISPFDEYEDDSDYKEIICRVLREQSKMTLSSGSKGKKTWTLITIGVCVASGTDWLGFKCNQQKVLYLNFELKRRTFNFRRNRIMKALGITGRPELDAMHFRESGKSFTIERIVEGLKEKVINGGYNLIIIDPQYKSLGGYRENEPTDMNKWWSALNPLLAECKASVIVAGHFTKGDSSNKAGIDRMSGSGVNAREPDVVASYDCKQNGDPLPDGKYLMEFSGMREDPDIEPFYMQWAFPLFHKSEDTVYKEQKKDTASSINDAMDILNNNGGTLPPGKWGLLYYQTFYAFEGSELTKNQKQNFSRLREKIQKMKLITQAGESKSSAMYSIAECVHRSKNGIWSLKREIELVEDPPSEDRK